MLGCDHVTHRTPLRIWNRHGTLEIGGRFVTGFGPTVACVVTSAAPSECDCSCRPERPDDRPSVEVAVSVLHTVRVGGDRNT